MRKIFTLLSALACAVTMTAQSFTISFDGQALTNGQTFDVGYTQPIPVLVAWESTSMVSPEGGTFICEASSSTENFAQLNVCCGGDCVTPSALGAVVRKEFTLNAGEPLDLQIHRGSGPLAAQNGTLTANVAIYPKGKPNEKFTYTCNFVVKPASEVGGISDVTANKDYVKVSGRKLMYSGDGQLSVYTILGTRVLAANIHGEGSIDLSAFTPGVYVYRLNSHSAKFYVR